MLDPGGRAFRTAVGAAVAPPRRDAVTADEDELARRVSAGDEEAFAELCRRRSAGLHALCRGILRNADDAHDAVGSATEKALAALRRGQLRGDVRPWLSSICRNEALSLLRVRAPWVELDDVRAATGPSPEATVLLRERIAGVAEDLAELPERQRRAIVLREVAELPYDRVALKLGMRQDAARQAVREARSALRDGADGRDAACDGVRLLLADGDGRRRRSRRVRSHLRACAGCRSWQLERGLAPVGLRAFLPGLWAALPGAGSWLPGLPAFLGTGGGALGGAQVALLGGAQAAVVAAVVAVAPGAFPTMPSPAPSGDRAARAEAAAGDADAGFAGRAGERAAGDGAARPVGAARSLDRGASGGGEGTAPAAGAETTLASRRDTWLGPARADGIAEVGGGAVLHVAGTVAASLAAREGTSGSRTGGQAEIEPRVGAAGAPTSSAGGAAAAASGRRGTRSAGWVGGSRWADGRGGTEGVAGARSGSGGSRGGAAGGDGESDARGGAAGSGGAVADGPAAGGPGSAADVGGAADGAARGGAGAVGVGAVTGAGSAAGRAASGGAGGAAGGRATQTSSGRPSGGSASDGGGAASGLAAARGARSGRRTVGAAVDARSWRTGVDPEDEAATRTARP